MGHKAVVERSKVLVANRNRDCASYEQRLGPFVVKQANRQKGMNKMNKTRDEMKNTKEVMNEMR